MSDMLGESVEDFQYFAKGAQTAGLSLEQFGMMGKDALDRLGEARRGEGEMMDFFEKVAPKIGVTIDMFKDLSGPEVIQAYYDGLEKPTYRTLKSSHTWNKLWMMAVYLFHYSKTVVRALKMG